MAGFLKQTFTWWNGNTIGTRFFTWRKGKAVGEDQFGNVYYEGRPNQEGKTRRWVIYKDYSEASTIPPGWHGWIHYRTDVPPSQEHYKAHKWEKPYQPNLTGTNAAYSSKESRKCPHITGDYDAWSPEK
ncbi:MAG: NADH:ubiquinone oxidoreductase 17.2 kD subunit [Candidatus Tokpelaia sp. JSC085]|nr:MAG: NADH:ubiquinone oxidoreductase 17.2 kD subunit [Candidatus Tokpelaia sp. JSC085]